MTNPSRLLAFALLLALTACGNKGPLVRPSTPVPEDTTPAPASPPSTAPMPQENPTPPVPAPPADDGAGND